VEVIPKWQLRN